MNEEWKKRLLRSKARAAETASPGWYSRGYLPHFSEDVVTQAVTFRLFDSMPQAVLARWREELNSLPHKEADVARCKRIDAYLDQGYGSCFLREDRIASLVQACLLYSDGERYRLHAWCVMPNHVHVLFTPQPGWEMGRTVQTWKSYTAHQANKLLERSGEFWQPEPYDRFIRDENHYKKAVQYIENNPVKAGLCATPAEWQWSSAGFAPYLARVLRLGSRLVTRKLHAHYASTRAACAPRFRGSLSNGLRSVALTALRSRTR